MPFPDPFLLLPPSGTRTHGMSRTREYRIWHHMKSRCENSDDAAYEDYGGRGIRCCPRWLDFANFFKDMGYAPPGMTLERDDNDGDYCPSNCRWATYAEQNRNRRDTRLITFRGVTKCATDWANETGRPRRTILQRLAAGWSVVEALTRVPQGAITRDERRRRAAARQRVTRAVARGDLTRPACCEGCGRRRPTQAHHHRGYAAEVALDVRWLCVRCHRSHAGPVNG